MPFVPRNSHGLDRFLVKIELVKRKRAPILEPGPFVFAAGLFGGNGLTGIGDRR